MKIQPAILLLSESGIEMFDLPCPNNRLSADLNAYTHTFVDLSEQRQKEGKPSQYHFKNTDDNTINGYRKVNNLTNVC